jgi:hypothetical protein
MTDVAVIRLGGRQFEVRALTFRQLRDIEAALGRALQAGPAARIDFDAAVDVIATALRRSDSTMDREAILDLEGTKAEFVAATRAVLSVSGYIEKGAPTPGEEPAGN